MRLAMIGAVLVAACGAPGADPTPSPSPLSVVELKYRVFEEIGRPWYCDPDFYPIQREDEAVIAEQRLAVIQGDADTYQAILRHNGLTGAPATTDERLAVYRDWKQLRALDLQPVGDVLGFIVLIQASAGAHEGVHVEGRVDRSGRISVLGRTPAGPPNCPICLAATTAIATPSGLVPVTALRAGMVVWTLDIDGERIAAPVIDVASAKTPGGHEMLRVILADGRTVTASPLHPTADGRPLAALTEGDILDGSVVVRIERLPYRGSTYDLRPAGPTGLYWADGVQLASTIPSIGRSHPEGHTSGSSPRLPACRRWS